MNDPSLHGAAGQEASQNLLINLQRPDFKVFIKSHNACKNLI